MKTLTEFSGVVLRQAAEARERVAATGVEGEALAEALATDLSIAADRAARLLEAIDTAGAKLESVRLIRVYQGETAPPKARTVGEFHYLIDFIAAAPARGRGGRPGSGRDRGGPGGRGKPRGDGPPRGPGGGGGGFGGGGFGRDRDDRGADRPGPGEKMPTVGAGWMVTRAPREDDGRARKGPPRKGGRPGPKRDGKPGDGRGDRAPRRAGPGGGRGPRPPAPPGEGTAPAAVGDAASAAPAPRPDGAGPGPRPSRGPNARREPRMPVVEERKGIARPEGTEGTKKRRRRRGKKKPIDGAVESTAPVAELAAESSELGAEPGGEPPRPNRRIVRPAEPPPGGEEDRPEPADASAAEASAPPMPPISPPPSSIQADNNDSSDNG
ncbi:MAG TPA: hypothetical protein VML75_07485 [Kofleriaceae bacterium]|nr:hypothetical protein [Kofleriaceae bacterium]